MLNVKQLMEYTYKHRPSIIDKARGVNVRFNSVKLETDADGDVFRLINATCRGEAEPRQVVLQLWGTGQNTYAWMSCTCPYWLYHCEVAVQKKQNTDIIFSNGARPKHTNPSMIPHMCKHIASCFLNGALNIKPKK